MAPRGPSSAPVSDGLALKDPWLDALYQLQALYELALSEGEAPYEFAAPVALDDLDDLDDFYDRYDLGDLDDHGELAPGQTSAPWRSRILVAAGLALVLASLPSVAGALVPAAASAPTPVVRSAAPAPVIAPPVVAAPVAAPLPVRLSIPAIRLASQLVRLDLNAEGGLQDLKDFDRPGWYAGGPLPGEPGAALIVGHVDSYEGPAVFQRLEQLTPGDLITVQRTDGSLVRFVVDRLASYPKDRFPTEQVFAGSAPGLRLITCFGSFDTDRKSYTRNLVVYASLSTPKPPLAQSRQRTASHERDYL